MNEETENEVLDEEKEGQLSQDDLLELIQDFKYLDKFPAYQKIRAIAEEQIKLREAQILTMPLKSFEDMAEMNQMRGERLGIKLFLNMASSIREQLEETLEEVQEIEEDEHAESAT